MCGDQRPGPLPPPHPAWSGDSSPPRPCGCGMAVVMVVASWSWQRLCKGMWNAMFFFVECLEAWKLGSVEACKHRRVTGSRASTPIIYFALASCNEM